MAVTPIIATLGWEVGKAVFASEKVFNLLRMRLMCGYVFFLVTCVEIVMYEGRGQNSGEDWGYTARTNHHLQHWLLDSKLRRCSLYNNLTKIKLTQRRVLQDSILHIDYSFNKRKIR